MKLYDDRAAINPRRVRVFLAEKGIEVPIVETQIAKGQHQTPEFLKLNPMGRVPVLELDDGTVITESIAICRYFEHQQPEPPLFGRDPMEQIEVEMWSRRMELEIVIPIMNAFVHTHDFWKDRTDQVPAYGERARRVAQEKLTWLDGELADREFIAGDRYTVADITLQSGLVLGKNTGTPIPDGLDNVSRWWAAVSARPSARA